MRPKQKSQITNPVRAGEESFQRSNKYRRIHPQRPPGIKGSDRSAFISHGQSNSELSTTQAGTSVWPMITCGPLQLDSFI